MTSSINRRTLVKGAAWAAPAVAATAAIPAYAASPIPGAQVTTGLYTTVAGLHIGTPDDPLYIDNLWYNDANVNSPDRNWSDERNMMTGGGSITNGNGSFTPYGTQSQWIGLSPGTKPPSYDFGGTGMWFASPVEQVSNTGDYFTDYKGIAGGKTTLSKGSSFTFTLEVVYPSASAQKAYAPYMGQASYWSWANKAGASSQIATVAGAQGSRLARNGVASTVNWGAWNATQENGKYVSRGTLTVTTNSDLTVSTASNGYPQFQQVWLIPPLKINGVYGTDVLSVRTTIASANAKLSATANGQTVSQIGQLKTVSAWFEGPVCNGTC